MNIRKATEKDIKAMLEVAKKLPEWFTSGAIDEAMPVDFILHPGFVAEDNKGIFGFITYSSKYGAVEITWLGVEPSYKRKGIGQKLLIALEGGLKAIGIDELRVDTLAESEDCKPYESTRAFYKKMGFEVEKVVKVHPPKVSEPQDMATLLKYF